MKRIFTDDKSGKFCSIGINETQFTMNYGKAETNGQSQTKKFAGKAE